jgi:hypothetical protein
MTTNIAENPPAANTLPVSFSVSGDDDLFSIETTARLKEKKEHRNNYSCPVLCFLPGLPAHPRGNSSSK